MTKSTTTQNVLSGDSLFSAIRSDFENISDHRQSGKVKIPLADALMSGFAMFSIKAYSLLQFDEEIKNEAVGNNLRNIYKIKKFCSDTQMREIVDPMDPEALSPSYKTIFKILEHQNGLEQFKFLGSYFLLSMDGTGYFSSKKVHCDNCQTKTNKKTGEITNSHAMLGIAIVHPDKKK